MRGRTASLLCSLYSTSGPLFDIAADRTYIFGDTHKKRKIILSHLPERPVFRQVGVQKHQCCGIVAAQIRDMILAQYQHNGMMDRRFIEFWCSTQFPPLWSKAKCLCWTMLCSIPRTAAFCCPKCWLRISVFSTMPPKLDPFDLCVFAGNNYKMLSSRI